MPAVMKRTPDVYKIGVLEVQGAFLEHKVALQKARAQLEEPVELEVKDVRRADDITDDLNGLIIPGGESTTMSLYLKRNKMEEPLRAWIMKEHHVTWGTCAGMILLSKVMENQKQGGQTSLGVMDTDVSRNYFGRQLHSFESDVNITNEELRKTIKLDTFPGVFIRAPAILKVLDPAVNVLATLHRSDTNDDVIVAVQQGHVFSTAFHPELTEDVSWHYYFLKMLQKNRNNQLIKK